MDRVSLTTADLAQIRQFAKYHTTRLRRAELADDIVSDSCLRLMRMELPDDPTHRMRVIRKAVSWAYVDVMRKNTLTARRVVEKIKRGEELSSREALRVRSSVSLDIPEMNWAERLAVEECPPEVDVSPMLAKIGHKNPLEFFVLVMKYRHGLNQYLIGDLLGITNAGVSFYERRGLALVREIVHQAEA